MAISFMVNGQARVHHGDPRLSLLDVLRTGLRLTGTKDVCREGFCGACTVMIDGQAVPACLRPVGVLVVAEITTIEGMASPDGLNPVQQAFVDHDVVQCGMCFPGMVISVTDLLNRNPDPTRAQVKAALSGNQCRCTGYERVVDAVMSLTSAGTAADNGAGQP
ncbi:MAG: (2Fe-2S)-binding protein [Pararhodobacter sp.]|nr:(2Fe-2S)-binding protein [Pararhodobacter sp.]